MSLRESINRENLHKWAKQSGLIENSILGKSVLCLHAGNIPLVGIQDLLAVTMTGGRYVGKFSKKDPYLLESLCVKLKEHGIGTDYMINTQLEGLIGIKVNSVLFAGSERNIDPVKEKLLHLNMINSDTPLLIRTAHFSIAWIHDQHPDTMNSLVNAIFRYAGKGCRSVAIVVAPFNFTSNSCNLTDYIESFWIKNPQQEKPSESLYHRYAMNKAVGIPQIWLDDFLIEEKYKNPDENFIVQWIKGGEDEVIDIIRKNNNALQSIYSIGESIGEVIENLPIESLDESQNPPIWWRPDGVDPIIWLQNHVVSQR